MLCNLMPPPPNQPQNVAPPAPRALIANKNERLALLQSIERERGSRVIAYITADREVLPTVIGSDVVPLFYQHLEKIGEVDLIDIFLYTRGGHTLTPNRIVHLVREYCKKFGVLVPFRAHSAGTSLALGANEIVMGPLGELGPVDPSVTNDFNPDAEDKKADGKKPKIPISVEDVTAFLSLAKEKAGINNTEGMVQALKFLTDKIHPLALGNVHRQYQLIRTMSKRLLSRHLNPETEGTRIDKIIDVLSEKLYFHGYEVSRYEAKEVIGLPVVYATGSLAKSMWQLLETYKSDVPLDTVSITGNNFVVDGAVIESSDLTHSFVFEGVAKTTKEGVSAEVQRSGWKVI